MSKVILFLLSCAVLITAGCAQTKYTWNDYDQKLYDHYKNPAEYDQFVENLKEVIEDGEASNKVPPGIYAEYGFALYEKANFSEAIIFFKKEQKKWPESNVLMTKMINNAQKRSNNEEKKKGNTVKNTVNTPEVAK